MEWILASDGTTVQWGFPPHLFPQARVVRLASWGWELQNPNVVLRAIDDGARSADADAMWADMLEDCVVFQGEARGQNGSFEVPRGFLAWHAHA